MIPHRDALAGLLAAAQSRGMLGPAPVDGHIDVALAFARGIDGDRPLRCLDLGSGAGIPGLVLALALPITRWWLVDARQGRAQHLQRSIDRLALGERVTALAERAEVIGRGELRGSLDVVTARGFGPPAVTAECAAPLLRVGGDLIVSDRLDGEDRWAEDGLELVGLESIDSWTTPEVHVRRFRRRGALSDRYPRRPGMPEKRPLF